MVGAASDKRVHPNEVIRLRRSGGADPMFTLDVGDAAQKLGPQADPIDEPIENASCDVARGPRGVPPPQMNRSSSCGQFI
jgi:hypothetical protein